MSLDLAFFKVGKDVAIADVDSYFIALNDHLAQLHSRKELANTGSALMSEARRVAEKSGSGGADFYRQLCDNLEPIPDDARTRNPWDLRLGSWNSVGGLNTDLRTFVGVGLEDVFPTAAAWPNELVLPDWRAANSRLRDMRDRLVASRSKESVGDAQLSSLVSSFSEVLRQAGYNLPSNSADVAKTLAVLAPVGVGKGNAVELIEAVDAMAATVRQVLGDASSRYLLVWSN
jgi:hypothetical protein